METIKSPLHRFVPAVLAASSLCLAFAGAQPLTSGPLPSSDAALSRAPDQAPLHLGGFDIVISAGAGLLANPAAMAAFNRAAQQWEAYISDPILVTLNADLGALDPGIIGSASSVLLQGGYDLIRNQLVADAANELDDAITAFLPTAVQFTALVGPGATLSGYLLGTKANLKAMGFAGLDASFGASDATITFSNTFAFDYDNSDGVGAGLLDFETVAAHEIGHALGFVSAVDDADSGATSISPFVLDLFRFRNGGASGPSTTAEFTSHARDLTAGQTSVFGDLDNEWLMSTGLSQGDGRQASHWKDDSLTAFNIGIMDPTLAAGGFFDVAAPDLRVLDLIGYEIVTVPEASSFLLIGISGAALAGRRTRRRA